MLFTPSNLMDRKEMGHRQADVDEKGIWGLLVPHIMVMGEHCSATFVWVADSVMGFQK